MPVSKSMSQLFVPAECVRPIEAAGLFGTWEWDFATGAITWSDGLFRILGIEPGSVAPSYSAFLELMHPEDRFGYELSGYDAVLEGRAVDSEFRIIRPDGIIRWVANKGEIFRDSHGQPYRAAGALIDITERRQAQEALEASEERYRALVKSMAVVEWRADPNGYVTDVMNSSEIAGVPEDEVKGLRWLEVIHPDDLEQVGEVWAAAVRDGAPVEASFRVRYSDGEYRWVLGRSAPLRNPDGSVREWVGMLIDIHAQQELRERLRISDERLRAALHAGRIIAWEYELGGHIVARSDNATEILGLGSTPLKDVLERIHPEDWSRVKAARNRAIAEDTPHDVEFRFIRPDGRMIWLTVKGVVLRGLRTMPDRFVGITFDITAQKEAERNDSDASFREPWRDFRTRLAPEPSSAADRSSGPAVTFQPTRLATRNGCEEACLVRVGDCLAAVLVRLDGIADEEHENDWFLEVGFGPWNQEALTFATWAETEDWVQARLPAAWMSS